jgi:hypothetical protein
VWRFRSSQKKPVASVASHPQSALVGAGFNPAPTTDAGQGVILKHSV